MKKVMVCCISTLSVVCVILMYKYNTHFYSSDIKSDDKLVKIFYVSNNRYIISYKRLKFLINLREKKILLLSNTGIQIHNILLWPHDNYRGVDLLDKVKCEFNNAVEFDHSSVKMKFYYNERQCICLVLRFKQ